MRKLFNITINSISFVPYIYVKRGFDLNITLKNTSSEGAGIVQVGDKEIGAYVSFYSNKVLYWK